MNFCFLSRCNPCVIPDCHLDTIFPLNCERQLLLLRYKLSAFYSSTCDYDPVQVFRPGTQSKALYLHLKLDLSLQLICIQFSKSVSSSRILYLQLCSATSMQCSQTNMELWGQTRSVLWVKLKWTRSRTSLTTSCTVWRLRCWNKLPSIHPVLCCLFPAIKIWWYELTTLSNFATKCSGFSAKRVT